MSKSCAKVAHYLYYGMSMYVVGERLVGKIRFIRHNDIENLKVTRITQLLLLLG